MCALLVLSSYPSVFWCFAAVHLELLRAILFIVVCQLLYFWRLAFKYCSRGLPTAFFFPDIAPSRMFTTNSLCLIVCPIQEWRLFFESFKSNLSSSVLWKTSSYFILSVHFIFNILLQHHVSNAFMTVPSFFLRPIFLIQKSNTPNTTFYKFLYFQNKVIRI